ncbi:MAG: peptide chain release factor N(5)-glutamine methyltransferase [Alphaproteobacteria bacterium]|nr:peptide chain release factor N(5)-glutamine methyltransferase [Alphaproteobacteria bacterium]
MFVDDYKAPVCLNKRTLQEAVRITRDIFGVQGIETPALDARLLVCMAGRASYKDLITSPVRQLSRQQAVLLESLTARRLAGEPVARLLGYKEFWGRNFYLGPDTLVPRPDSETLIEAALAHLSAKGSSTPPVILDLGVGSGCLLITLLAELPQAFGIGVDISMNTLLVACGNAVIHGVAERSLFLCGHYALALGGPFDMIIANPPYIERDQIPLLQKEVAVYEPSLALDGGQDGLDEIRRIVPQIHGVLEEKGCFLLEIGSGQSERTAALLRAAGFFIDPSSDFFSDLGMHIRVIRVLN